MVQLLDWLDVVRLLVGGSAFAAIGYQPVRLLLEWVRGEYRLAEIQAKDMARTNEVKAIYDGEIALVQATVDAEIAKMRTAHDLRLALERDRASRPARQLQRVRPPPRRLGPPAAG